MALPTKIEIAQSAKLKPIAEIAASLGLTPDDIEMYGKYKAKIRPEVYQRNKDKPDGKLIIVTAITPTKFGEGKTTMSIGLAEALGKLGKQNIVVLRQPSMGPVFGVKGGACGAGYAQRARSLLWRHKHDAWGADAPRFRGNGHRRKWDNKGASLRWQ